MRTNTESKHTWKFFLAGGVNQVMLRHGADIVNLEHLDQKLWVALACPTRGIEFDTRTLDLLDADKDGRIRVPEILAAVAWVKGVLLKPDDLLKGGESVPLAAIKDPAVAAGAKRILESLKKGEATEIALADVADRAKIFAENAFNGDGVFPPEQASDETTRKWLEDIVATVGSLPDRSGKPGVNQVKVDAFFAEAKAYADWYAQGEAAAAVFLLGPAGTAGAAGAVKALKAKVDDYFARGRLAAFDPRAQAALNRLETEYLAVALKDLSATVQEVAGFPLARIEPGKALPLELGLNPAWTTAVAALVATAVDPILGLGKTSLAEAEWSVLLAKLAPYEAWQAAKPPTTVEKLGLARLREILAGPAKETIDAMLKQDLAVGAELAQLEAVEKMLLFQRDLVKLLNNFVNFSDFYAGKKAIFQAGTLYLDGRSCNLCVPVTDAAKHAALAGLAATCLAYCDCTRPSGEKMTIAAAFTDGDSDNLIVGRNGVFYDRKGRDWDATITKIVPNPISIREAFWSPYKKLARMIEEQIAKRAAAADADASKMLAETAETVAKADTLHAGKPAVPPPAIAKKVDVGTVAAIGVALGSIGGFLAALATKFIDLGFWMPFGVAAIILMISGPSMILAYLKLRQRNLGPILDANGWAINGRARINVPFGSALTDLAILPPGSERTLEPDPYAENKRPWRTWLVLAILLLVAWSWYTGRLDEYLPIKAITSEGVLGENAPAAKRARKAALTLAPASTNAPTPAAASGK